MHQSHRPSTLLPASWHQSTPFLATGALAIVVGGLASAIAAGNPTYLASWAVAYLVLVVGVAQIAFGAGLAEFASTQSDTSSAGLIFALFNLGNAGVLAGSLLQDRMNNSVYLVDLGSLFLAGSLVLGLRVARNARPSRLRSIFCVLVAGLLISILIGIVLAHR